ncbi:hypothetical protein Tco_0150615 [Tanacetum coccineum]
MDACAFRGWKYPTVRSASVLLCPGRDQCRIGFSLGQEAQVIVWPKPGGLVDSSVFPISVPLYLGGALEKDSAPHLTARQEQIVKLLEIHKAPFCQYSECFLCLVGLSPYYPFDKNSYPAFEYPDGSGGCYFPLVVSTRHYFMPLVIPVAGGSSSAAAAEVSAPTEERQEDIAPEEAYLELADPDEGATAVRQSEEEVVTEQPKKVKKKRLLKLSDIRLVGSRLPDREQLALHSVAPSSQESEGFLDSSTQTNLQIHTIVKSSSTLGILVDTTAATITSTRATVATNFAANVNPDLAGPSQLEESEGSDDSFYEPPTVDPSEAKRWYVPRYNITNDSLLDDGFSCRTLVDRVAPLAFFSALRTMDYDQLYTEFNVGAARQVCLGAEVRSRAEHELELKEKLRAKYVACGRLLEEKDLEILRLKSQLAEKEAEATEVIRLRDQVCSLSREKSALTAEVSVLKVTVKKNPTIRSRHLFANSCPLVSLPPWMMLRWPVPRFLLCMPVFRILRKKWRFSRKSMPRICSNPVPTDAARNGCLRPSEGDFIRLLTTGLKRKCLEAGIEHEVQEKSFRVEEGCRWMSVPGMLPTGTGPPCWLRSLLTYSCALSNFPFLFIMLVITQLSGTSDPLSIDECSSRLRGKEACCGYFATNDEKSPLLCLPQLVGEDILPWPLSP